MIKKKLCDIADIVTGGTPSTTNDSFWVGGNIPWLQSGCCQNCYVDKADKYITQLGYKNSSAKLMPKDTIMIALTGATAGKIGYLGFEACGNQSITGITPHKEKLLSKYLYYFLIKRRDKTLSDCIGGAQPHISQGYVKNIEIPIRNTGEQQNIVDELDKISILIENNEKQLKSYDELVKSRFIEMFDKYEKVDLSTLADITMGQSPDSKSYNDDGNGMPFFQGKGDYGDKVAKVAHWTTAPSKIVDKDVVLMSVRAPVGPVNFSPVKCCIGRGLCGINAKVGKTNNEFLYNALGVMQDEIAGKGVGSTFAAITKKDVYEIKIPNAPIKLCNEFSMFAQQVDKSKFIIQKQIDHLQELLDSKMNEYFGE